MPALNNKIYNNNPVWTKNTSVVVVAAASTTSHEAISPYVIIDNQSGGNLEVRPNGFADGILLSPGESFSVAMEVGTKFDIVNSGASAAVLLWLE